MRMRNDPQAEAELQKRQHLMLDPASGQLDFTRIFKGDFPVYMELGCGKGQFITEMAARNPEARFIGVELRKEALLMAVKKAEKRKLSNCRFIWGNILELEQWVHPGSVTGIYLNFSDPWPKSRHDKRRLTHSIFLKQYRKVLSEGGSVQLRTDNQGLFEFSLNSFLEEAYRVRNVRLDWHGHKDSIGAPRTEYEEKFARAGQQIFQLTAFPGE